MLAFTNSGAGAAQRTAIFPEGDYTTQLHLVDSGFVFPHQNGVTGPLLGDTISFTVQGIAVIPTIHLAGIILLISLFVLVIFRVNKQYSIL